MASFVFVDRQKNRQTDKQTGQNLYAPTLWILGKKKKKKAKFILQLTWPLYIRQQFDFYRTTWTSLLEILPTFHAASHLCHETISTYSLQPERKK